MDKPLEALERMRKEWFGTQWSDVVKDAKAIIAWADSVPEWPKELTRERLEYLANDLSGAPSQINALRALAAIAPVKRKRMVNLWERGGVDTTFAELHHDAGYIRAGWRKVGGPFEIEERAWTRTSATS